MTGGLLRRLLFVGLIPLLAACAPAPLLLAGATAGGVVVAHDRRSPGAQLDDQSIEMTAMRRLVEDPELGKPENLHVSVTAFNGLVLLTGEARSAAFRGRVEQLVLALPKVRKVYNEVRVGELASMSARARDTWITAKVKSKMLGNREVDGSRIKVVTDAGTVYLMGIVSRAESNLATALASDTEGVQRIIRVFEYTD